MAFIGRQMDRKMLCVEDSRTEQVHLVMQPHLNAGTTFRRNADAVD